MPSSDPVPNHFIGKKAAALQAEMSCLDCHDESYIVSVASSPFRAAEAISHGASSHALHTCFVSQFCMVTGSHSVCDIVLLRCPAVQRLSQTPVQAVTRATRFSFSTAADFAIVEIHLCSAQAA